MFIMARTTPAMFTTFWGSTRTTEMFWRAGALNVPGGGGFGSDEGLAAYGPTRGGVSSRGARIIAGLEVRHVHLHLLPIETLGDLNFANADPEPEAAALDEAAERTRAALRGLGHADRTT